MKKVGIIMGPILNRYRVRFF